MPTSLTAYIATAVVFFGLDFVWLSQMGGTFYKDRLGDLMAAKPDLAVAGLFYLVYVFGIIYFAVWPAINGGGWTTALVAGAILGFIAYGTYDMTNLATLRDWPVSVSIVDICWGTFLTGFSALIGYLLTRWIS
ncbi:putative membrane protein [Rhodopseudomonas julia]|uniref:Membrane protein n=1 Tax=Rhodopseudomonas julia TaxID=200617 RepID=A0ABU0C923_9BRAD|nr:DUF2177 family protein [Rhodopseudomonas julia]MDQ0326454.1 putative membrane protein [Rhodopseudomonas julia]